LAKKKTTVEQLRGAARLAVTATRGVTDVVETMHHTIGGGPALLGKPWLALTKLLSAPTYGAIRGATHIVDVGLDLALTRLAPLLGRTGRVGSDRGAVLAALNGVLGDYLAATDNPLAITMRLCSGGTPLVLSPKALAARFKEGERLLVLVHGSSMGDTQWLRHGHDHGAALARQRGFVPLYVRYNSGLHVSQNGRALASLLERLIGAWPRRGGKPELVLLAHSMGGLVARSACLTGEARGHLWRTRLRSLVTLGCPHHGAPLERGGNWAESLLGLSRYSAPIGRLGRLRSAGVTDLRYGNLVDSDWQGRNRFALAGDPRAVIGLPQGVACFAVAGSTSTAASGKLAGDGLVPVDSALGRHADPARTLDFGDEHCFVAFGTRHLELLDSQVVYAQLRRWL